MGEVRGWTSKTLLHVNICDWGRGRYEISPVVCPRFSGQSKCLCHVKLVKQKGKQFFPQPTQDCSILLHQISFEDSVETGEDLGTGYIGNHPGSTSLHESNLFVALCAYLRQASRS